MPKYIVRPGDTLSAIAKQHGTDLTTLLKANPQIKDPGRIYVGQIIRIPSATDASKTTQIEAAKTQKKHTVTSGESLSLIAKRYGVDVGAIIKANPDLANPSLIHPGQVIAIPEARATDAGLSPAPAALTALADVSAAYMNMFKGKNINGICANAYADASDNHCAHFVSHGVGVNTGMVCGSMKYATRNTGASIRVNDVYNACPTRGPWSEKPDAVAKCLIFVTLSGNVTAAGNMGSHPRKHIGVYIDGTIWHYSNGADKVVTDTTETFKTKFLSAYGKTATLYYGTGITCVTDKGKIKTKLAERRDGSK